MEDDAATAGSERVIGDVNLTASLALTGVWANAQGSQQSQLSSADLFDADQPNVLEQ
jgi:hypothetical protein